MAYSLEYYVSSGRDYIAKNCPLVKRESTTCCVTAEDDNQPVDPWVLLMTEDDSTVPTLSLQDPASK